MKRETFLRSAICAAFVGLFFCLGAQVARAQIDIRPYVDCVERERDATGALTGKYIAHFGYVNFGTTTTFIPVNSASNFTTPVRNPPGQPNNFLPGVNPRALSVALDMGVNETWGLTSYFVTASFTNSRLCGSDDQNSALMTYQGRLSDGGAAANGIYDLQFQSFDAATGGAALSNLITVEDVTVANGVFTVQLNLGATSNPANGNLALNQAILAGKGGFLEIGVRPGNSTAAFTILTPRQPITAVPLAMRANTANNAFRAAFADLAENSTNATNATNAANATNATNATNVFGGFVQLPLTSGAPPASECDASSEYGRQKVDAANARLYICTATGWKSTTLQ